MSWIEPPRLSPSEATMAIRLILEEGTVDYSGHCWNVRMPERNVSPLDIEHLLREGQVIQKAKWDSDYGNWKYRVEGTDIEGDELTAIAVISIRTFQYWLLPFFDQ